MHIRQASLGLHILSSCALILLSWSSIGQSLRSLPDVDLYPFYHGVASGDPLTDRVIIWTRVSADEPLDSIEVAWRMALDTGMTQIVQEGTFITNADRDYTVKVDVSGLDSDTWYFYDFKTLDLYSIRGRTHTLPESGIEHARFAVGSCSNYEHGYFNAYNHIGSRNDIQAMLHLGDYIYEYETGGFSSFIPDRNVEPEWEIIELDDYRLRYSHYRLDEDLRKAHQQYPWFTVWDDHEFANDAWFGGAQNHQDFEGDWFDRKDNAWKAHFEWMPMREQPDNIIRRYFDYGDLIRFYFLDTRVEGRDEQVSAGSSDVDDPSRTLLGADQKLWLSNTMSTSETQWNAIAQQVMVAPVTAFGIEVNTDQWDGYQADRDWLYGEVQTQDLSNFFVLTGDIHTSWANNLPLANYQENTQTGSVGAEFVVTSITSTGLPIDIGEGLIQLLNPHVEFVELTEHGYMVLDVNDQKVQGNWYYVDELETQTFGEFVGASWCLWDDTQFLDQCGPAVEADENPVPLAPLDPMVEVVTSVHDFQTTQILGLSPNPVRIFATLQFSLFEYARLEMNIYDLSGSVIHTETLGELPRGLHYRQLQMEDLPAGVYMLELVGEDEGRSSKVRLVKL